MNASLRMSIVQDNPVVGDINGNLDKAISHIHNNKDSDLIVLSECFLSGYPLNDLALRPGFIASVDKALAQLRSEVAKLGGPAVLIGAPVAGAALPYNAACLIEPTGAMRSVYKTELPNSDVFDERRTFASSTNNRPEPLTFRGFRLGVMICEDMWHGPVARSLADEMADVLLVLNGSPYQGGKHDERLHTSRTRIRDTGLPLIYVNQFGGQDELVFDGASFVMNLDYGVMQAKAFSKDVLRVVLRKAEDGIVRIEGDVRDIDRDHLPYPEDRLANDYDACVLGLRDYIAKTGAPHIFLGVSGGLDSALVAAMAVDALGSDKVIGIMMPSRFTGDESLDLAQDLMLRLKIRNAVLPIAPPHEAVRIALDPLVTQLGIELNVEPGFGIMDENIQARLRGMSLMALTNSLGGMLLSTGNKSEMSVGYATLYGDMNGGYNPLKSVYKSDAFKMCTWRNAQDSTRFAIINPIPEGIITRPPSAELAADQTDAKSLGDYDALDTVLKALIEDRMSISDTARALEQAFPKGLKGLIVGDDAYAYVSRVAKLVRNAQYKRHQSAPGVKLHSTDFGLGWRYPIAGTYSL